MMNSKGQLGNLTMNTYTRNFQNVKYQKKVLYCEFEEIKCAVQFVAKYLFRNDAGINRLFT